MMISGFHYMNMGTDFWVTFYEYGYRLIWNRWRYDEDEMNVQWRRDEYMMKPMNIRGRRWIYVEDDEATINIRWRRWSYEKQIPIVYSSLSLYIHGLHRFHRTFNISSSSILNQISLTEYVHLKNPKTSIFQTDITNKQKKTNLLWKRNRQSKSY